MTKSKALFALLIVTALQALSSHVPVFSGLNAGGNQTHWSWSEVSSSGGLWLITLVGALALLASGPKMSRVILFSLGVFSLLGLLDAFTFTSVSAALKTQTGHDVDVTIAVIGFVIVSAGLGLAAVAATMRSMNTWVAKAREAKSTNPWTAIDRGDDPTI
ncbi:MAG: hypothetical protein RL410_656 [Actinomycetota bacterium]|jgi:hypothetical protein